MGNELGTHVAFFQFSPELETISNNKLRHERQEVTFSPSLQISN